jgi:hypothetical protein
MRVRSLSIFIDACVAERFHFSAAALVPELSPALVSGFGFVDNNSQNEYNVI